MKRLAWATDVHLNFLSEASVLAFCRAVSAAGPDALVLSGDIAEAPDLALQLRRLERALARPIYFVLGNHDFYKAGIAEVREQVRALCARSEWLSWLPASGMIELTPETALVGHDGWADGRNGDYAGSQLVFNDWVQIRELRGLDRAARLAKLNQLGDEAAAHLADVLPKAFACFRHVIVVTHAPPFQEACRYEGEQSPPDWQPHLSCKAVGDVLLALMREHRDRRVTVLCGHTHGAADVEILPNLRVRTGSARYGAPEVQSILLVA